MGEQSISSAIRDEARQLESNAKAWAREGYEEAQRDYERTAMRIRFLADDVKRLEEENAVMREPFVWQPFATAPTDGRCAILVYRPDAGVFTAVYHPAVIDGEETEDFYWFTEGGGEDLTDDLPTHWMPLPPGPAKEG